MTEPIQDQYLRETEDSPKSFRAWCLSTGRPYIITSTARKVDAVLGVPPDFVSLEAHAEMVDRFVAEFPAVRQPKRIERKRTERKRAMDYVARWLKVHGVEVERPKAKVCEECGEAFRTCRHGVAWWKQGRKVRRGKAAT